MVICNAKSTADARWEEVASLFLVVRNIAKPQQHDGGAL